MAAAARRSVLGGYRGLLLTIRTVFGADRAAVVHCTNEARKAVRSNAAESDPAKIAQLVKDMSEAAEFLRTSIAQAQLNDSGRYALTLEERHGDKSGAVNVQTAGDAAHGKDKKEGCCGGGCG